MEEFALIAQLKHYGIDFLIPKHIDIEKTEYEENDYDGSNAGKHGSHGTRASDYI